MRDSAARVPPRPAACLLVTLYLMTSVVSGQDGALMADDSELFSNGLRTEFQEMNETFADFGFEIEVIEGEQPTLEAIIAKYGDPERSDEVEVVLWYGGNERPATVVFYLRRCRFWGPARRLRATRREGQASRGVVGLPELSCKSPNMLPDRPFHWYGAVSLFSHLRTTCIRCLKEVVSWET